jgi:hypothetical protein
VGTAGAEQGHQYDFAIGTPLAPLRALRGWLRTLLTAEPDELVIDVELVATELVTNAYEHTDCPLAIRIRWPIGEKLLRVEVDDGIPSRLPASGASSRGGFRGRGLLMIEGICRAWGVEAHGGHKTVWADVPLR